MEIIVACPANCATGGPEALHAFVSNLNKINGVHAYLWYWDIKRDPPMPEEYKSYECPVCDGVTDEFRGVLVVPEVYANRVMEYKNCIRAIYWLGLDAYAGWHQEAERGAFLEDPDIIHIAQSEYAYDYLRKLKVKHLYKIVDTLNEDYYEDYEEQERNNVVLYNPAKATWFMWRLMDECSGIEFRPIQGMTRDQVIDAMRHAKLYVDFGEFPGRERIPREAALCGCCLITSKIGAADYLEDFWHFYKYDSKSGHTWMIINKIRYVLEHYEECRRDFDRFREDLIEDRYRVKWQTETLVNEIQRYYPGA